MSGETITPDNSCDIDPELTDAGNFPKLRYATEEYQPMLPGMDLDTRGYVIKSEAVPFPSGNTGQAQGAFHLPEFD